MTRELGDHAAATARHAAAVGDELPRQLQLANDAVALGMSGVEFLRHYPLAAEVNTLAAWMGCAVQNADTKEVILVSYANDEALRRAI